MDLDELRSVQSKERRKDSLQHLRDSFYEDVAAYLDERKRRRDERAASVDKPFADEQVRKLSDEIETAEEVVESLYERRVGKVVKLASFAAAGAPTDSEGMTIQEAELFEDLVVRIEQNKDRVLDVLEGGSAVDVDVTGDDAVTGDAEASSTREATATAEATPAAVPDSEPGSASDAGSAAPGADGPGVGTNDDGGVLADAMGGASDADAGADDDGDAATESSATPADAYAEESEEFVPGSEPDRAGDAGATDATSGPEAASATSGSGAASATSRAETASATPDASGDSGGGRDTTRESDTLGDGGGDGVADADSERRTVRVTRDVGEILGVDDREYDLAAEDVVTLPAENAGPLVERDAAEPIE
ncbi:hypothetical protein Hbl1158_08830 [Halobaculum sp. CBA1158]|uniref:hypothetical protein n=1 Tax=Halobaculum sp. CBA1158 TaxID=2904243 RepID=UPI001F420484|nr:hypothetical protein [Halobaculum sp. CBA1158]UIO98659.1 hypothetical protein Hbl1158_08830 [Halobaculum sp. CBA1158]